MMRTMLRTATLIRVLCFALILAGCAGKQKKTEFPVPGDTDFLVESFTIKGAKSVDASDIKAGLQTREATWFTKHPKFPFLGKKPEYFNHMEWQRDLDRIRTYYHARGYFDARIVSENIYENPEEKTVRLSITINEGSRVEVTELVVDGLEATDLNPALLLRKISIRKGTPFSEQEYLDSKKALADALKEAGFAYAEVAGRAVVKPDELSARVFYYVDPGPRSQFGDVEVVGLDEIPEDAVREAITIETGEMYSPSAMQETQEHVYDLGVFAVVKVSAELTERPEGGEPAPEEVEQETESTLEEAGGLTGLLNEAQAEAEERVRLEPVVPVTIRVKEAKLWSVRVGGGVAADVSRQDAHGRLDWSSRNFLGGLRKLEHFNSAGYAWAPGLLNPPDERNEGVIVDTELRFTQPQFLERFTKLETRLRLERRVEPGFILLSPTAKIGLRRRFFRDLSTELSYNFALYVLSELNQSLLDPDLRLPAEYILEYLQQRIAWDKRNDFLNPTRGYLIEFQIQEATSYIGRIPGVPTGGHFDYVAPSIGTEVYFPYRLWLSQVLALRARVSTMYNVGRDRAPPIPQRLYAGGVSSMRSFGRQQLSLYSFEGEAIPIGGLTRAEAAIEPRIRVARDVAGVGDVWVAPFLDAATVLGGQLGIDTGASTAPPEQLSDVWDSMLYGTGLGAWWLTPVGPVRLDFAYTLSDISDDYRFRRCEVQPTAGGRCNGDFVPIEEDPIQDRIRKWNVILGIGHSF